jgi:hypothetical protein
VVDTNIDTDKKSLNTGLQGTTRRCKLRVDDIKVNDTPFAHVVRKHFQGLKRAAIISECMRMREDAIGYGREGGDGVDVTLCLGIGVGGGGTAPASRSVVAGRVGETGLAFFRSRGMNCGRSEGGHGYV